MTTRLRATYQQDRFGKQLTLRDDHSPEPLATVTFPLRVRVTYGMLNQALNDRGYTVDGNWRPSRSILRADLLRITEREMT